MQTINLKQYYPFCTEDTFVEVSDEIVEAFLLDKRAEAARERKMYRYKAFYSLDCNDGIENAAIGWAQPSPEDCLMEKEAQAEYAELLRRLYEALSSLPPTQARRVHARYMLNQAAGDRKILAERLGISAEQLAYVTNSEPGHGLLFFNNVILPFADDFPKDTELYKLLTTKPSEVEHAAETEA